MEHQPYFRQILSSIRDMIGIDSSQKPPLPGMPFGQGPADALAAFLALAEEMGFETRNYDNYAGEVIFGEGEEFAILCHLDVVPAGEGWSHPPFGGEICDGRLYGRGTMDDKGPAVICLYCLKALKEEGFVPSRKIKLIVGCNEETGWACIDHYNQSAHMPEEGFTPDADFPVIYAEKGILHLKLSVPIPDAPFLSFSGGEASNMVCAAAKAEVLSPDVKAARMYGLSVRGGTLLSAGRPAHASTPELGENALEPLLRYFAEKNETAGKLCSMLFDDCLKLKEMRDETGNLTLSPNVALYEEGVLHITVDIRYPATFREEDVLEKIEGTGFPFSVLHSQAPLYNDRDGTLITTLLNVYNEITGETREPIAIGGGTYARALRKGAGFGPQFLDEPSTIHQQDEYITLENIDRLYLIYKESIRRLTA